MKAIQFNEDFPPLLMEFFQSHYVHTFKLNSLQYALEQFPYIELSRKKVEIRNIFPVSFGASNRSYSLGRKTIKCSK